jgi:hypothetical protein
MTNRIREVRITQPKWDPGEAELWISVTPEFVTPTTEVRGRLMGPRCVYSTTVEVAYPLRSLARQPEGMPGITRRVIIPEASLWEPECPFLYEGIVELWQDGQRCDQAPIRHGLRLLQLNERGLKLNGQNLVLRGQRLNDLSPEQAGALRKAGINAICLPVNQDAERLYDMADRLGLFAVGRQFGTPEDFDLAQSLQTHPSCLGWLLTLKEIDLCKATRPDWPARAIMKGHLILAEVDKPPTRPLPDWVFVVACAERTLAEVGSLNHPKIVLRKPSLDANHSPHVATNGAVIGWIR